MTVILYSIGIRSTICYVPVIATPFAGMCRSIRFPYEEHIKVCFSSLSHMPDLWGRSLSDSRLVLAGPVCKRSGLQQPA